MDSNQPQQYIDNQAEFRNLNFYVDNRVLIPRIESEDIVNLGIKHLDDQKISHPTIIDVGTGSGCLGISIAHHLQKNHKPYTIFLSDISPDALMVTRKNVDTLLDNPSNIFFQQSDLLTSLPKIRFDLILANLPYIPSANIPKLDSSVKDFEPHLALDGGPDGSTLINQLLVQIPDFLTPKGIAILEFDDTHTISNFKIPKNLKHQIVKDCFGVPRFLLVELKD